MTVIDFWVAITGFQSINVTIKGFLIFFIIYFDFYFYMCFKAKIYLIRFIIVINAN